MKLCAQRVRKAPPPHGPSDLKMEGKAGLGGDAARRPVSMATGRGRLASALVPAAALAPAAEEKVRAGVGVWSSGATIGGDRCRRKVSGRGRPRCCRGNAAGRTGGAGGASAGGATGTSSPRTGGAAARTWVSGVSEASGAGSRGELVGPVRGTAAAPAGLAWGRPSRERPPPARTRPA